MSASPPRAEALLRRLEWTSLRRLDGLLQGDHRTLLRGVGLDLADLREYQVGDDVRRIDWNATARLDQPQVRDDLEERELSAWFVVDLSASIDFGSGAVSKRDQAIESCALLARLLVARGNRVGAIAGEGGAPRRRVREEDVAAAGERMLQLEGRSRVVAAVGVRAGDRFVSIAHAPALEVGEPQPR